MVEDISYFYEYIVFIYGFLIVIGGIILTVISFFSIRKYKWLYNKRKEDILKESPYLPGVSVIAPAYNEETTIISNVHSMLTLDYPLFEVIIVNDGSTDKTLELLIEEFQLVETPFAYIEKIKTKPFRRIFRSTTPEYDKLTIVDKENGGTKADGTNAGINASVFPYFLCTDVDCILSRDVLTKMILPVLDSSKQVIAVGATLRMANSCEIDQGVIIRARPPRRIIPCFQEVEYLRSYLVAKMGWSGINASPNISGGLGLFDKSVVIESGGYDPLSHAEDMDMLIRMVAYMRDFNKPYRVLQIPLTTCWTEGPPNLMVLNRQRTRWGRGLMQFFIVHRKILFNPKYGRAGLITLPYVFIFEFLAPVVEIIGIIWIIYFLFIGHINFETAGVLLGFVYLVGVGVSLSAIILDITVEKLYKRFHEYLRLIFFSLIEILCYHPFTVIFSVKGYIDFIFKQNFEWGAMKRQGFDSKETGKEINLEKNKE